MKGPLAIGGTPSVGEGAHMVKTWLESDRERGSVMALPIKITLIRVHALPVRSLL